MGVANKVSGCVAMVRSAELLFSVGLETGILLFAVSVNSVGNGITRSCDLRDKNNALPATTTAIPNRR